MKWRLDDEAMSCSPINLPPSSKILDLRKLIVLFRR
jgi:hypothetical protein